MLLTAPSSCFLPYLSIMTVFVEGEGDGKQKQTNDKTALITVLESISGQLSVILSRTEPTMTSSMK